jgi:hypothetical protein
MERNEVCIDFLNLFFNSGELALFGQSQYVTNFVKPVNEMMASSILCTYERVSLNPLVSECMDKNVTSFRNIMIESDTLSPQEALYHINKSKIPYSCITFSGNKSLHFYVCLEDDIGSLETYNYVCKWVLRALGGATGMVDIKTISPSRKARLGGGTNNKTGLIQTFKPVRGRIPNNELQDWMLERIEYRPIAVEKEFVRRSTEPNPHLLKQWIVYSLEEGVYDGKRNAFFYEAAINFAECGFDQEQCIQYLRQHSRNLLEGDFSETEMQTTVNSAYKRLYREGKL